MGDNSSSIRCRFPTNRLLGMATSAIWRHLESDVTAVADDLVEWIKSVDCDEMPMSSLTEAGAIS